MQKVGKGRTGGRCQPLLVALLVVLLVFCRGLPVAAETTVRDFKAELDPARGVIHISWLTSEEDFGLGFTLERSSDGGQQWETVSSDQYTDGAPKPYDCDDQWVDGDLVYRLTLVDIQTSLPLQSFDTQIRVEPVTPTPEPTNTPTETPTARPTPSSTPLANPASPSPIVTPSPATPAVATTRLPAGTQPVPGPQASVEAPAGVAAPLATNNPLPEAPTVSPTAKPTQTQLPKARSTPTRTPTLTPTRTPRPAAVARTPGPAVLAANRADSLPPAVSVPQASSSSFVTPQLLLTVAAVALLLAILLGIVALIIWRQNTKHTISDRAR